MLVTTFHGLGLRVLRELHEAVGLGPGFRVADEAEAVAVLREQLGCGEREARRLLPELARRKRTRATRWPDLDPEPSEVAAPLARYDAALRKLDLVDLDDLLVLPVMLLAGDDALAARYRDRHRLVAVGFRGSNVGFFLRFGEDFPAARTVRLTCNYRSSPAIVAGALQAIAPATLVRDRVLDAVASKDPPASITIHTAASEPAEAEFVVATIDRLLGGASFLSLDSGRADGGAELALSFADVAVLYRTDAQAGPLAEALGRAGMPFQKRSHDRLLQRPAVRALVRALHDQGAPATGRSLAARLADAAAELPEPELDARGAVELLAPLAERCGDDLGRFLAELALGEEVDTWDPRADRVSLLTLHAAKGLEFPVVFLTGCEDGLLPLRWGGALDPAQEAEERRLFFVGMTRARSHLFLSHARRRAWRGTVRDAVPSPFLTDIEEALLDRFRAAVRRRPARADGDQLTLL
jgi:superfamily I DNA/RNA helicase